MNPFRRSPACFDRSPAARSPGPFVIAASLILAACAPKQDPADPDQCSDFNYGITAIKDAQYVDSSAAVDLEVTSRMPGKYPGVAVAVVKDGAIVYMKGYGVADKKLLMTAADDVPVTKSTVFGIGSISKVLTATATMKLVEMNQVALDAPIANYFPHAVPIGWDQVTVRDLLAHRSGFTPDPDFEHPAALSPAAIEASFGAKASQHPRFAIWEVLLTPSCEPVVENIGQYEYSNLGYTVLGALVDHVTTHPAFPGGPVGYERFVWSLFAGAEDAAITAALDHPWRHDDIVARAESYSVNGVEFSTDWSGWQGPSGGWSMTVGDLARVILALDERQILGVASTIAMRTNPGPGTGDKDYGLGLILDAKDGKPAWSHSGRIDGFRSEMIYWPGEGVGVAVLANGDSSGIDPIAIGVARHWFSMGGLGGMSPGPGFDPIDRAQAAQMATATFAVSKRHFAGLDACVRPLVVRYGSSGAADWLARTIASQSRTGRALVDGIRRDPRDVEGACRDLLDVLRADGRVGSYRP